MNELTFEVPGKPKSLNELSNESRWEKTAEIKYWRETAGWVLKNYHGPRFVYLVDLEFTVVGPTRYIDHISPAYAVKGITDALTDAKVIHDDAPRFVNDLILKQPLTAKKPGIRVTVRYAAAA